MNIANKVKEIIADSIEIEVSKIEEDTAIGDFPKWDSMGQIIIISALEKEFDFKFDPEVIMDLEDVGDMIEAVEEHVSE
ncbi:acyl carrier protein [uncultured Winogradskyella sp.]|uniref:acyl carrier protein n=1 Tax=uncultured Winogradskyella sp. TaxID=395353 RepID=UPI0026241BD9|nr:acyl carrier protein [uncultured Winogradskyella sp.]|tara:strand:+ start:1033 stop:1269 length:237 start_codon:yes stop_codon:yes gene_type:complete